MGNERKLRLIQVAKEFKVGLNTITDFLQKKGIKSDGSPNTLVDSETYAVLEKEFGANRAAGNARDSIRERISLKQTTITLEEAKKQEHLRLPQHRLRPRRLRRRPKPENRLPRRPPLRLQLRQRLRLRHRHPSPNPQRRRTISSAPKP